MLGLDDAIARLSDGTTLALVVGVAVLLGLRHAGDPDHVAAVSTLVAGRRQRTGRLAARLGAAWGLGHGVSLFALGLPIVLYRAYLPQPVQQAAETAIGFLIVGLAVWLLVRWRRGIFHVHLTDSSLQVAASGPAHAEAHAHAPRTRSPLQAFGIGVVHGVGGSAGVGILLLSAIADEALAVAALAVFAVSTAASMALLSGALGATLGTRPLQRGFHRVAPLLGVASLAFGVWYALAAFEVAPYVF